MLTTLKFFSALLFAYALVWNCRRLLAYAAHVFGDSFTYHLRMSPQKLREGLKAQCTPAGGWTGFKAQFSASWHDRCSGLLLKCETDDQLVLQPLLGGRNDHPDLHLTFQEDGDASRCLLTGEFRPRHPLFFKLFFGYWHASLGFVAIGFLCLSSMPWQQRLPLLFILCAMMGAPWLIMTLSRAAIARQLIQAREYLENLLYDLERPA